MNIAELSYIAGIVDGEGNIAISLRKDKRKGSINILHRNYVKISNTDLRLLEWIKERVGKGTILKDKRKNRPNCRNCYHYHITNREATKFLMEIYPYLLIKKEQADVVFRLRETYNKVYSRNGTPKEVLEIRNECYEKLKQLHHREF